MRGATSERDMGQMKGRGSQTHFWETSETGGTGAASDWATWWNHSQRTLCPQYLADCGCGFLDELRTETWGIWEKHGQNSWVTGKEQPRIEWLQLRELKEDFQDWSILILQAGYRGRLLERCPMHTVGKEARTACLPHQRCEGHSTCVPTHQMRKRPREKK